eukprot:3919811-Alexandrium_andersonii.AAC.1
MRSIPRLSGWYRSVEWKTGREAGKGIPAPNRAAFKASSTGPRCSSSVRKVSPGAGLGGAR